MMAMWLSRVIMSLMSLSVTLASDSTSLSPILDRSRKVEKCEARQRYGHPDGCGQCAKLIPSFNDADEGEDTWRVAVHIDRAGSITQLDGRHLRGQAWKERAPRRELPHEYFVASMEATLHTISVIDPTAQVHLAVFTEERWGELVDETGTPIDWDIANEICEHLGLICSQTVVFLNNPEVSVAESLECVSSADVFLSSEDGFSHAAAMLTKNVRVLTDRWEVEDDEDMIALNPANTVAGLSTREQDNLMRIMGDYRECSLRMKGLL